MKLRQSENYSSVFEVVIDEQRFAGSAAKVSNMHVPTSQARGEAIRNTITEIQNRSFESCQRKQREKEEKIREFQQQCNREYEEFQRRVNRERDSLIRSVMSLSVASPSPAAGNRNQAVAPERTSQATHPAATMDLDDNAAFDQPLASRWTASYVNEPPRVEPPVQVPPSDLEDMEMVYANEDPHNGPAFDASDDSNSSNESVSRISRRRRGPTDVAQSAPMNVPVFRRRNSSDDDGDLEENARPFDFRRMTLEATSLSRFTNKSVVSDGTELFGPIPDSSANPPQ